jgi:hypothetical protein
MKMNNILKIITIAIILSSCETKETKINSSKEVVLSFVTNLSFDNYDLMLSSYPSFRDIETYWKLKDFNISSTILNNNIVTVVGKSENIDVLFDVEKIDGKYIITKSKGLSSHFNSNLYKFSKKIGCIGQNHYDAEISRICKNNEYRFNQLVRSIKSTIEESVIMENHTVTKNYGWASGDITLKNYSRFTIPGFSYNLYVVYTDSKGNTLFTSKERMNFQSIPFGQSKTISVFESNSRSFQKVGINLKIINTEFIEEIIGEYAEGRNCVYVENL